MKTIPLRLVQVGHRLALSRGRGRFQRALRDCRSAQLGRLRALIRANGGSAYGRAHRFADISSLSEWQQRVPIVDYDALEPWIARAAQGEAAVLTAAPVRMFERTGGSTAANKLIPYTDTLLAEFGAATAAWMHDLYTSFPGLAGTRSYWSISPATRAGESTPGGTPIGFESDTEYFSGLERFALRRMLAVPAEVARVGDMETWAQRTAEHLVEAADLGLISVWHPSFLVLLLRRIEANLDALLARVAPARAARVRDRLQHCALGEALWPRLAVVSCWADGPAASAIADLRPYLPRARIQPKGLMATEGVISVPQELPSGCVAVAAVASHFLEFIDLLSPSAPPRLAHELEPGADYAPVISTGGGLYRYRLGDAVRCVGYHLEAPVLRFEQRIDQVCDLRGEKLSPGLVAAAIAHAQRTTGSTLGFALLAPVQADPPYYCLYAEGSSGAALQSICRAVEDKLRESHGYRYARSLGQLGPLEAMAVQNAGTRYLHARAAAGQRLGDVKPALLDGRLDWSAVFGRP